MSRRALAVTDPSQRCPSGPDGRDTGRCTSASGANAPPRPLQTLDVCRIQPTVLRAPQIEPRAAEPGFTANVLDWHALFGALHGAKNLVLAELALAHDDVVLRPTIMPNFQLSLDIF